ncbi:MAG: hypothetical protein ACRC9U_01915 [Metamycoplasmataceae bacterium]
MNKKLLISLGSLSTIAVVAPILATVSCASDAPVDVKDLTITAKADPKLTAADVTALEGTNATAQWDPLAKLFEGKDFVSANQANFTVSIDTKEMLVTLTAKTGFTIGGKDKLVSNKYTVEETTPAKDLTITVIEKAVELTGVQIMNLTGADAAAKLTSLKLLFNGTDLTNENLANFKVSVDSSKNIVTLEANQGFTIGGQAKLDSKAYTVKNTNINATKKAAADVTQGDIDALTATTPNLVAQLTALTKLFDGITKDNQTYFTITVNTTDKTVTLNALQGFVFGANANATETTLVSNAYTIK